MLARDRKDPPKPKAPKVVIRDRTPGKGKTTAGGPEGRGGRTAASSTSAKQVVRDRTSRPAPGLTESARNETIAKAQAAVKAVSVKRAGQDAKKAPKTERQVQQLAALRKLAPSDKLTSFLKEQDVEREVKAEQKKQDAKGKDWNPGRMLGDAANLLVSMGGKGQGGGSLASRTGATSRDEANEKVALRLDKSPVLKTVQQLTRVQSASAGGVLAGLEGKNPAAGAVKGFKKNDKSFVQVAKKLGLKGEAAEAVGLVGDIFLDPTTYVRLGFKPIEVNAGVQGARDAAKVEAKALRKGTRAVRRGKMTQAELTKQQARAAQRIEVAGRIAARKARNKKTVAGLGPKTGDRRGLQVQGRTVATVPAAVTRGGRRVQQSPAINEVLTKLNPKAVPTGFEPRQWQQFREDARVGRAKAAKLERDAGFLARLAQDAVSQGPDAYKRIVDMIEAGTVEALKDPKELATAVKLRDFYRSVSDAYAEYGVKLDLVGTINSGRQLDEVLKAAEKGVSKMKGGLSAAESRQLAKDYMDAPHGAAMDILEKTAGKAEKVKSAQQVVGQLKALRREVRDGDTEMAFLERAAAPGAARSRGLSKVSDPAVRRTETQTAPADFVPRQLQSFLDDILDGGRAARQFNEGIQSQANPGTMKQRELHRGQLRDFDNRDIYSADVPLLTALYGAKTGRKLGSLHFYNAVMRREATPLTRAGLDAGGVAWRLEGTRYVEVDPKEAARLLDGPRRKAGKSGPVFLLPEPISKQLKPVLSAGDPSVILGRLDTAIRGWKMANTITRPGFFVNTALGNTWQLYLRDSLNPRDMATGFKAAALSIAETRNASKLGGRPIANFAQRHLAGVTVKVDGRDVPLHDLINEALDAGTIKVGSQLQDPTEISAVRQAELNTKEGGIVSRLPGSRDRKIRPLEGVGAIAEAMDDFGKLTLYARGRRDGMRPQQATEHAFTGFIDYGDLTNFERTVMRRLMPFYVFTARNLPLQIKGIFERPGKLANFEKARQALEAWTGVDIDPVEERLVPADQDRLPVTIPGLTSGGRQVYTDLRLPVTDIGRPINLLQGVVDVVQGDGTETLSRGAQRYLADLSPAIKAVVEPVLNRRFDYDRPISAPDVSTQAAPALAPVLKLLGISEQHKDKRTGKTIDTVPGALDHVVRLLGGSPAAALLNLGKPDSGPSGVSGNTTALSSYVLGVGNRAPRQDDVTRTEGGRQQGKLIAEKKEEQNDNGKTVRFYELDDELKNLSEIITRAKARIGYPESKERVIKLDARDLLQRVRGGVASTPQQRVQANTEQAIKDRLNGKGGSGPVDSGMPAALDVAEGRTGWAGFLTGLAGIDDLPAATRAAKGGDYKGASAKLAAAVEGKTLAASDELASLDKPKAKAKKARPVNGVDAAVAFAQARLGRYAEDQGSNRGGELDQLQAKFNMVGEPWCAIFATTVATQGGASRAGRTAAVAEVRRAATAGANGYQRGVLPGSQAKPGDLWMRANDHIGFVEKVDADGTIHTIEGNTSSSGGVARRTHAPDEGDIARPVYAKKATIRPDIAKAAKLAGGTGARTPGGTTSGAAPAASYNRGAGGAAGLRRTARQAAEAAGINPDLFEAQINQESGFRKGLTSSEGASGVAQIMPETARAWGVDPNDAKAALKVAAREMRKYVDKYGEADALRAYNAGEPSMHKGYPETEDYVRKIMGAATSSGASSPGGPSAPAPGGTTPGGRGPSGDTDSPAPTGATADLQALIDTMLEDRRRQDAEDDAAAGRQKIGDYLGRAGNTSLAALLSGEAPTSGAASQLAKLLAERFPARRT